MLFFMSMAVGVQRSYAKSNGVELYGELSVGKVSCTGESGLTQAIIPVRSLPSSHLLLGGQRRQRHV